MTVELPRGYAKGRAKRREILDRAMSLFGAVGYRGASLREIATRCGISHPGLLHHFPTKQSLLLAVLEHRDEVDGERMPQAGADGVDPLRYLVELTSRNAERRGIVELFTMLSAEATSAGHPANAYFVARYRAVVDAVEAAYAQARADGMLRDDIDPGAAARGLVAMIDGLQIQWLLDNRRVDMVAVLRAHIQAQLTVPL